jgi:16S rRNA (guanine966-N2)-methyltransferase|tara:strand:+ start:248 stop:808 length:561 start_codon:yes stop_codon:yes gene_type:complete
MRIISGNFKGKKILEPKDVYTRPLKDLTKESIFNIINHSNKFRVKIEGSVILDLFSGVGSFGIECLSRKADKVYFVENYKNVLPILKKNLSGLKSINNFEIIEKDIYNEDIFKNFNQIFDIIFLDPPYKDKNIEKTLVKIKTSNILKNNGVLILHRHKKEKENFSHEIKIIEEKIYGISKIIFLTF